MAKSQLHVTRYLAYVVRGIAAIVLVAIAILIFNFLWMTKPEVAQDDGRDDVRRVEAMEAAYAEVRRTWEGFGTAAAMDSANVTAENTGLIVEVPEVVRAGQSVRRGDTLAVIDAADYEEIASEARLSIENLRAQVAALAVEEVRVAEQVELAQEELQVTRDELRRLQEAFQADAAKQIELDRKQRELRVQERMISQLQQQLELVVPRRDQLNAQIASQQERLAGAERDVERSIVRSPIDGIVQELAVEEGERVGPGTAIARVVSLDRIEVPLRFPISARGSVAPGSPVLLQSRGAAVETWQAPITRILPETDVNSRTFLAFVEFSTAGSPTALPTPGQFIRGTVQSRTPERRLILPRRAILNRMAYIAEPTESPLDPEKPEAEANGGAATEFRRVVRRPVDIEYYIQGDFDRLSPQDTEWAVLGSGSEVAAGEVIILTNIDELKPGMAVVPVLVSDRLAAGALP